MNKSQLLGILLAIMTAIGCIAYEKIVKQCSYAIVGAIVSIHYVPFIILARFIEGPPKANLELKWIALFAITGATGPIWYLITKNQNVSVSATYEAKYIVILAIVAIISGDKQINMNTIIGMMMAVLSIYFISK